MPQDELVIRVRGLVVTKHNSVVPAKLSNDADICGITSHNGLRHLASGHLDVIACVSENKCLKFKAMVLRGLG